jgi:hypothetical protein
MSEWWTYTLSDFLLFSPRVYYRLLELHNRELWPAHILTSGMGLVLLWLVLRPPRRGHRTAFALLGAAWIWVGWASFWQRYATINWAAAYVAPVFAFQGLLLIWFGAVLQGLLPLHRRGAATVAGQALLGFAVIGYPLLAPVMGRGWLAAESFGLTPDPTAVATLAFLSLATGRARWLLSIIPVAWCAVAGVTLWAMESGEFFVAPGGAVVALALGLRRQPIEAAWRRLAGPP